MKYITDWIKHCYIIFNNMITDDNLLKKCLKVCIFCCLNVINSNHVQTIYLYKTNYLHRSGKPVEIFFSRRIDAQENIILVFARILNNFHKRIICLLVLANNYTNMNKQMKKLTFNEQIWQNIIFYNAINMVKIHCILLFLGIRLVAMVALDKERLVG